MTEKTEPEAPRTINTATGAMRWLRRKIPYSMMPAEKVLQQQWRERTYNGNIWTGEEKLWWQDVPTVENE